MQGMRNQAYAKHQLKDDGQTGDDEREIKAEKMITVDVNLELVHVDDLKNGRHDKHKAQQDLQGWFDKRVRKHLLFRNNVVDQFLPPAGIFSRNLRFREIYGLSVRWI